MMPTPLLIGGPARALALAAVFVMVLAGGGCNRGEQHVAWTPREPPPPASPPHPVVLLAVDGLEWRIVLELIREGRMPRISEFMERGVVGKLEPLRPILSPRIWTSVATGVEPPEHGILGFVTHARKKKGGKSEIFTGRHRKVKALWNIATEYGLSSAIVGWWMTFPVEPIDGVMVAQVNVTRPSRGKDGVWKGSLVEDLEGQVHPPERQAELLEAVPEIVDNLDQIRTNIFGTFHKPLEPVFELAWRQSAWSIRADAIYERITHRLLAGDERFDFLAVYFGGPDVLGHRMWRYSYPRSYTDKPTALERSEYGGVLHDYYAHMDGMIGGIIDAAPDDAVIMIVSDHGMGSDNRRARFNPTAKKILTRSGGHLASPEAFFAALGPGIRRPEEPAAFATKAGVPKLGSILDIGPTLLALLDIPVGADMPGAALEKIFAPSFSAEHPVREIDTHTEAGWFENRDLAQTMPAGVDRRLEQLRSLGYIE